MSARKTERLLNLVICLLATRRFLGKDEIRRVVPGYSESNEAFERAFERDKEELRELGVPLETGSNDAWFVDEVGYRISRTAYELPDITLEPDEAAVLGLAARVWQRASLGHAASTALMKLRAAGVEVDDASLVGIEPRIATSEPAFGPLWDAVRDRAPVAFAYRGPASAQPRLRHLEPWGIVSWHGRWYVAGHDRDRQAPRVFRLSRVVGAVDRLDRPGTVAIPPDADVRAMVTASAGPDSGGGSARLRIRAGAAFGLRRRSATVVPADGWDTVTLAYADEEALADEIVGFGADVVADHPAELRDAVVRRLRAVTGGAA